MAMIGLYTVFKAIKLYMYSRQQFNGNEIRNKAILITGCDTGFGYATAMKLDKMGYTAVATCLQQNSVDKFLNKNESNFYKNSIAYKMDVTNMDDINNVKDKLTKYLNDNNKVLWGIVNNAGVGIIGSFEVVPLKYQKMAFNIMLIAPTVIAKVFLPLLYGRKNVKTLGTSIQSTCNGGRIVNISSASRAVRAPFFIFYGSSKSGLSYHTDCLRMSIKPLFGVHACVVEPGYFATEMATTLNDLGSKYKKECDKDVWELYKCDKYYKTEMKNLIKDINNLCEPNIDYVINDIIHALTSKYPKDAYQPKWGILAVQQWLPVKLQEYLAVKGVLKDFNI